MSDDTRRIRVVWEPDAGPQTSLINCPIFEVFYGGARGGGKTDGVLGEFAFHADEYGEHAIGLMIRRTRVELVETIERSKQIYGLIGAKYHEQANMWRFPNGARLRFAYLERDSDADGYQGHSYTRVYVEEIGNFPSPAPILKLMATLRSGAGVRVGFRATGNPGGAGHQWVKARYIDPAPRGWQIITSEFTHEGQKVSRDRVFIPSKLSDNKRLSRDGDYVANLHMSGSAELVRAWLEGDWNVIAGAFFPEFGAQHVIAARTLPDAWPRFRSGDWGSARPFSVGWWAISDGSLPELPRGALVRYREWYGWNEKPNEGMKLTAEEVGQGIAERDAGEKINNGASVLDPAAFAQDGGPSIAERIHIGSGRKVDFRRADNRRIARLGAMGGWDQVRSRLKGEDDRPMIYFMANCVHAIRTLPALQHDDLRPEDVDTEAEDHAPDECFRSGTIISTPSGGVPIEQLRVGNLVETSDGPYPVDAVFSVGERAVFRVELSTGAQLVGTGDHPVWVIDRYVGLSRLQYGDMLRPCIIQTNTAVSPAPYGPEPTGQSRAGASSTTSTSTIPTTNWATLNASRPLNIGASIVRLLSSIRSYARTVAQSISPGTIGRLVIAPVPASPQLGASAASIMNRERANAALDSQSANTRTSGIARSDVLNQGVTFGLWPNTSVENAAYCLRQRMRALSGAGPHVVSVTPAGFAKVYNLTVSGPENYYASGVLVHNCRYACMSRPYLPKNQPKREDVWPGIAIGGITSPNTRAPTMDRLWKDHDRDRANGW